MSTVFLTEKQFQISLDSIRLTKYFVVVMKKKKSTVITIIVTIHNDDTQSVEVKGGDGSTGPMDTLWSDVESSLRGGLMVHGIIDQTGIGDWEV